MVHRISKRPAAALTLACLLVVGCARVASSAPANDEKSAAKDGAAVKQPAKLGLVATVVPTNPVVLQRRRLAIARMLEASFPYRTLFEVGLKNAKLAGPFQYNNIVSLFPTATRTDTLYCASAQLGVFSLIPVSKNAVIRVVPSGNGSERLIATIPNRYTAQCANANYGPFPELEQLRTQRRKALGKAD
jgi:hypothetical protein